MDKDSKHLKTSKPRLTIEEVKKLLNSRFGIQATVVKEFESYDDLTYYVKTNQSHGYDKRTEFIFKVLNSEFTALKGVVIAQTNILNYLKSFPELGCQIPLPNVDGDLLSFEMIPNDVRNGVEFIGRERRLSVMRLLSFIPGKTLDAVSPLPASFFYDAGKHLGRLQKVLQEYHGDVDPLKLKATSTMWCLTLLPELRDYLPLVTDVNRRELLEKVIGQFEKTVLPVIGELRQGIVYQDFNCDNVLVVSQSNDNVIARPKSDVGHVSNISNAEISKGIGCAAQYKISGIIDFDDMLYSCLVYEVAIGMAYMIFSSDEPIKASAYLLAGFETLSPLTRKENRLLKTLVAGRCVQSLLISLYQAKIYPDNTYVSNTQVKGWTLLELWWNQTEDELQELWDSIKRRCADAVLDG